MFHPPGNATTLVARRSVRRAPLAEHFRECSPANLLFRTLCLLSGFRGWNLRRVNRHSRLWLCNHAILRLLQERIHLPHLRGSRFLRLRLRPGPCIKTPMAQQAIYRSVGSGMLIFLAGLRQVPPAVYEAAAIDGAGAWARFRYVTVPHLTPLIFFNLVMGTIGALQVFAQAYVMTGGGPANSTLFFVLYIFEKAFDFHEMGYACALAWVLFAIALALTLLLLRSSRLWVFYEARKA